MILIQSSLNIVRSYDFQSTKDVFIFRSDVLGQVMPLVGRDWSQGGVTRLFSAIKVSSAIFHRGDAFPTMPSCSFLFKTFHLT